MRGEPSPLPVFLLYSVPGSIGVYPSLLMIPTARRDDGQNGATRCLYGWFLMKTLLVFLPRPLIVGYFHYYGQFLLPIYSTLPCPFFFSRTTWSGSNDGAGRTLQLLWIPLSHR